MCVQGTYMGKTAQNYMENEEEANSEKTHYYALRGSGRSSSAAVCARVDNKAANANRVVECS